MPFLPVLHTDEEDRAYFESLVAGGGVTVAVADGDVAGYLALDGDHVDHLYIRPDHYRQGLGSELLRAAQAQRTQLDLWVFQRNTGAIAFYEAHGFTIVESTDGTANDEGEPDHRMAWSSGA